MSTSRSNIVYKTIEVAAIVLALELLGLIASVGLARAISFAFGEALNSYPWSIVLTTDFCFIILSAILAEFAVATDRSPLSWSLTRFCCGCWHVGPFGLLRGAHLV
jgi:hypothetical protein